MNDASPHPSDSMPADPWRIFPAEAMTSAGTNLLVAAIYFYMADRYHWGLKQNLLLATGQGLFYVAGAMTAGDIAKRVDRYFALGWVYVVMSLLSLAAFFAVRSPMTVAALLLLYSTASAIGWPIIESLASSGLHGHALSRRIGHYNTVWSSVSIVMLGGAGFLIAHWPSGIFLLPFASHGVSAVLMFAPAGEGHRDTEARRRGDESPTTADSSCSASPHPRDSTSSSAHSAEPELLRVRVLALWLSRVALPAAYVVLFSLSALMPSLPVMKQQPAAMQTLIACVWMAARGVAFFLLGVGTWWHTRPRLLLVAALIMLIAFFGVTVRPSDIFAHGSPMIDLLAMIISQIALGAVVGLIYTASLYFGMVLSDGSTEHGGYHEALIGVGFIVGPGAGAIVEVIQPGNFYAGIAAVGSVVLVSVIAVAVTSILAARRVQASSVATDKL